MLAMGLQAIGIAVPLFSLSPTNFIISAVLFGATFMGITTLATTLAREISPRNCGRIISILTATYALGQVIGPSAAGVLITYTESFYPALAGAAAAVFTGAVLLSGGIPFERQPLSLTKKTKEG